MTEKPGPISIIVSFVVNLIFMVCAMEFGMALGKTMHIEQGRIKGIVYCSEKPEQCKLEYQNIKIKEEQK